MPPRRPSCGPSLLRQELTHRNLERANTGFGHELTIGEVPSVLYLADGGRHGNFLPAAYHAICANPDWCRRLAKCYTGTRRVPRSGDRKRFELDCANSSDALLMNIFCYPGVLRRSAVCSLLGIEPGLRPEFGFRPRIPSSTTRTDRTEIDLSLGHLLIEAKLTETGFQTASLALLMRYRDLDEIFAVEDLPISGDTVDSYQLIRGVLAAHALDRSFVVLCDDRRADLIERWFRILSAVRGCELRKRLSLLTWQELAAALPPALRRFLDAKYGIAS
jgi:hypothetical protein